jgi:shikimate dehydrogenase
VQIAAAEFSWAVALFARNGGAGANCTLPHKASALALADTASSRAQRAGTANLLRFDADGAVFADNTDGAGLVADLTQNLGLQLAGKRLLVVGTGGAAAGILGPLLDTNPAELVLCGRSLNKAQALAARFGDAGHIEGRAIANPGVRFDFVINATSASLAGEIPGLPATACTGAVAYDLCYDDNGETPFTRWARDSGAGAAVDGWGMLVEQAAESCLVWTGNRPNTAALLRNRVSGVHSSP